MICGAPCCSSRLSCKAARIWCLEAMAGSPRRRFMLLLMCFASSLLLAATQEFPAASRLCVADLSDGNRYSYPSYPCVRTSEIGPDAYKFSKLKARGNTSNAFNATATLGLVAEWPGLNTLGLSIARLDLAPGGIIPPHTHSDASELLFVLQGSIYTGFVSRDNKLYAQTVKTGEAFVFPKGLLHFQHNTGQLHASSISVYGSDNPAFQLIPTALFSSGLSNQVVSKSIFINEREAFLEGMLIQSKYDGLTFM